MDIQEYNCPICNNTATIIASGHAIDFRHQEVDWATFECKYCKYIWSEA